MAVMEDFGRLANDVYNDWRFRGMVFRSRFDIENRWWELDFWLGGTGHRVSRRVTRVQVIELGTTSALLLLLNAIFEQAKAELEAMSTRQSFENYAQNYTSISRDELAGRMREAAASVTFNGVVPAHNTDLGEPFEFGIDYWLERRPAVGVAERPLAPPPKPKRAMVTADGRPVRRFVQRPEKTT